MLWWSYCTHANYKKSNLAYGVLLHLPQPSIFSSSCISPMDANQPALWPGSSYPPFGIESSPLRVPQEECWPTSSTMLGDDDRFQYFDRLQEDPSSFYSSSRFCLPDMPSFDTLEAISQWHPTRVSPSNFQPAASSRATIAPSLMMGCFGHDHATFVNNDVKSDDQDALTRNASIDKKKKHVYGDPNVVKGQWTAQEDRWLMNHLVFLHLLIVLILIHKLLSWGFTCENLWAKPTFWIINLFYAFACFSGQIAVYASWATWLEKMVTDCSILKGKSWKAVQGKMAQSLEA